MLPVNPSSWSCQSGDGHHTGLKCHQERTSFMWFPAAAGSSPEPRHSRAGRYFSSTAPARIDHGLSESRSAYDSKVWVPCDVPPLHEDRTSPPRSPCSPFTSRGPERRPTSSTASCRAELWDTRGKGRSHSGNDVLRGARSAQRHPNWFPAPGLTALPPTPKPATVPVKAKVSSRDYGGPHCSPLPSSPPHSLCSGHTSLLPVPQMPRHGLPSARSVTPSPYVLRSLPQLPCFILSAHCHLMHRLLHVSCLLAVCPAHCQLYMGGDFGLLCSRLYL